MKYAVNRHTDQIKEKPDSEPEFDRSFPTIRCWHFFASREQAAEFIIERAKAGCVFANGELQKAKSRLRKCLRKFDRKGEGGTQ